MFSISDRFNALELRIKGIEDTLSKILSRLDAVDQTTSHALAAAGNIQLPSREVKDGKYVYQALDETKNELRVLVVYGIVNAEGEGGQDDVVCELVHVSLDSDGSVVEAAEGRGKLEAEAAKKFTTLSYTV